MAKPKLSKAQAEFLKQVLHNPKGSRCIGTFKPMLALQEKGFVDFVAGSYGHGIALPTEAGRAFAEQYPFFAPPKYNKLSEKGSCYMEDESGIPLKNLGLEDSSKPPKSALQEGELLAKELELNFESSFQSSDRPNFSILAIQSDKVKVHKVVQTLTEAESIVATYHDHQKTRNDGFLVIIDLNTGQII